MTPEPSRRLAPSARWLWRAQGLIATVPALVAAGALRSEEGGAWWALLPVAVIAVGVVLVPELRWRRWRYAVRDAEIDLLHGTVRITRTLVPMLRPARRHDARPARAAARPRHRGHPHGGRHDHDPGARDRRGRAAARPHRRAGAHRR